MISAILLTSAMVVGQPPTDYSVRGLLPTALQDVQPKTPATGGAAASEGPPGNPDAVASIKTDKEEPAPATPYLLERSLAGTAFGQRLQDRGITVFGWTQMSYNVSSASRTNLPRTLDDRANEFLLNQNWLHIEKTLDPKKNEVQFGWNLDLIVPGSDYRYTLPRGLLNSQLTRNNGSPQLYGIDPYQFYGQAFLPNLGSQGTTVKVGRFATHCSYEVVQGVDTPFVSRSYMFQYNPFTHTGVWATTPLSDNWTISNGLATGSDTFIDPANRLTYIGQLRWAPPEGKTNLNINYVITDPKYDIRNSFAFYNYYGIVLSSKFTDKLTYVLDSAYSHTSNAPIPGNGNGFADWYGAANYFIYAHTDKVSSILRAEVFNDSTGFRTGTEGVYTEVTYGVAWKPTQSLIIRPSARYDYNASNGAFEGKQNLWTGTMEFIVRW
ncbi:MAG: porin [Gemmataceae bacterium]|nr:porin [Gemmataceae bacterium]